MTEPTLRRMNPLHSLVAFGTGCSASLLIHFNGELARYSNVLFSSWTAHATGSVIALIFVAALVRTRNKPPTTKMRVPRWAYLGGMFSAGIAILTTFTVNSSLQLSGTLALVLAGQTVFSLAADRWGLFGLSKRLPELREFAALGLIIAGSLIIILAGAAWF